MRAPPLLAAACALLAGCRACTMTSGETVYEKIDGPVAVEVVRSATLAPSALFSNVQFALRVQASPPFDAELPSCLTNKYALAENEAGTVVAVRCAMDGSAWHFMRLGRRSHVVDCADDQPFSARPDFAKLPRLADVAPAIVACHEAGSALERAPLGELWAAMIDQLRDEGGAPAVRAVFAATRDRPPSPRVGRDEEDPWMAALASLGLDERAAIDADLCPALLDPKASAAYVRAARRCPVADARVGDAALTRMRAAYAGATPPANSVTPLAWAAPLAARRRPAEAGAAACAFLATTRPSAYDPRTELALATVAVTRSRCAAVEAWSTDACASWPDCDGGLCPASQLAGAYDPWLALDDARSAAGTRPRLPPRPTVVSAVAAYTAAGTSSDDTRRRAARRAYRRDYGDDGPACSSPLDAGTPCNANGEVVIDEALVCSLPLDGGRVVREHCALRADDDAGVVGLPVRACLAPGARGCARDEDCCRGACLGADAGVGGTCAET